MDLKLSPFDAADYLTDEQSVRWFLESAIDDGEVVDLVRALRTVARSRKPQVIADAAGLSLAELETALGNAEHPDMAMIVKILHGLGLRLSVQPIESQTDAA